MAPKAFEGAYRRPTELEKDFLRVATRGYPLLENQIEDCEIADYDPTGWCYVRVLEGMPFSARPAQGPKLRMDDPAMTFVELLLWTNEAEMLECVEVVEYGSGGFSEPPYRVFVDASSNVGGRLEYNAEIIG